MAGIKESVTNALFGKDVSLMETIAPKKTEKTKEQIKRVEVEKLELAYMRDPVAHRGVELTLSTFLASDYKIICANPRDESIFQEFLTASKFDDIIYPQIAKDRLVYGNAWIERLYKGKKLSGVAMIDAKSMDFRRDLNEKIEYDVYGNVTAYIQYLGINEAAQTTKETITQMGKIGILLDTKYITHIPFKTIGNNPNGVGLIEPIYNSIIIRQNMEKALGENTYNMGMPLRVVYVGDPTTHRNPGANEITEIKNKIEKAGPKSTFVLPYYVRIEYVQGKEIENIKDQLHYFIDQEVGGMGAIKPLVTGSGEAANRSTLNKQTIMFLRNIKEMQKTQARKIESEIFAPFALQNKFKAVPKFKFEDVLIESLDSRADRIGKYLKYGAIKPDDLLEKYIRDIENFPRESREEDTVIHA